MSLEFFNSLSGTLNITLSEPPEDISPNLSNQRATPTAEIAELTLAVQVWEGNADFRAPTSEELTQPALSQPEVTLRGLGDPITHQAPNGQWFTVDDLLTAVTETERATRHQQPWFDGIDVHHIFFEGIEFGENGIGEINWGS
ncbi:hypothetical protein ACFVUS_24365 [Nocardia sp. NPDC058058]|uniref:hypothetical protein n=1 Tax=Nocardia sp. NPDC058058 TaxID=3346317 RepID=UPI0036DCF975